MSRLTRREFVRNASAAAAVFALPRIAFSKEEAAIRIGLIGCGGRGTGAAEDCINSSKNLQLAALADLFPERLEECQNYFQKEKGFEIPRERCFTGFDAYQKLLSTEVDLVILATPPGFRPIHFAAAIEAGKHVFMEKPVAVDPVGVRKIMEAGKRAQAKKLAVVSGTQRRHQKSYQETLQRLHDGAIGEILSARCYWNQGGLWHVERKPGMSDSEWQIRNWLYFDWLSGDHIVEQHIHNIDVINWVMGTHPVKAVGLGGRQVRTDPAFGNVYDHFTIDFEYPKDIHLMSMSRQMEKTDGSVGEIVIGTKGRSNPAGSIEGEKPWKFEGQSPNAYVQEHADLIASIRSGNPINEAQRIAETTLTAIMGREAAYSGKVVTWEQMLASNLDFSPPKYEFGELPIRPVPIPGTQKSRGGA